MKSKMLKTMSLFAVVLVCAVSAVYAEECGIQCNYDYTVTGWDGTQTWENNTWTDGVYTLPVNCIDTCTNEPAAGYVADFTLSLRIGTSQTNITNTIPLNIKSTPTNDAGNAYIKVPLMHIAKEDNSGYVHLCPFDDIACTGGTAVLSSAASAASSSEVASLVSSAVTSNCFGLIGCCQITITVNCCIPPRTFTYCTYDTQYNCIGKNGNPDPCTTITATWSANGACNYCTGNCENQQSITLSSFTAQPGKGSVTLNWTTETETNNAGFNIYRATAEDGEYVKLNSELIPAKSGSVQGASYQFIDKRAKNRKTYYYKLEDVDINGNTTLHSPVSATPRVFLRLFK